MSNQQQWSMGLMSGTSLDGIDIALIRTDGIKVQDVGPGITRPYFLEFKEKLKSILGSAVRTAIVTDIEAELTHYHATIIKEFLHQLNPMPSIQIVGFHGQTIFHRPRTSSSPAQTLQIGDGVLLSRLTGLDVVYDFRTSDVNAGGEGAPLVPLYHQALARDLLKPLVVINIGGVANLTFIDEEDELIAFDTGPGGALLDDWILKNTGLPYDARGETAQQGVINQGFVDAWLQHPYFSQSFPKSLDRNTFAGCLEEIARLAVAEGAATLTAFTVQSIALAIQQLPKKPVQILLSGGGRHNNYLRQGLKERLSCAVDLVESVGWNGDLLEAQAFAFLAVRVLKNLPTTLPLTTGVSKPTCGGKYIKAAGEIGG